MFIALIDQLFFFFFAGENPKTMNHHQQQHLRTLILRHQVRASCPRAVRGPLNLFWFQLPIYHTEKIPTLLENVACIIFFVLYVLDKFDKCAEIQLSKFL